MPFLDLGLLRWLIGQAPNYDVVIPVTSGQLEPMHAVYRRSECLQAIGDALARGEKRMISYFDLVRVLQVEEQELRAIDPDLLSFFNVNTPEDLEWARAHATASRGSDAS